MKLFLIFNLVFVWFLLSVCSCKKASQNTDIISNAKLIGTWAQQSPCAETLGGCYTFKFTNNYRCYITFPYTDSCSYILSVGDSIIFIKDPNVNRYKINITGDSLLVLENFYTPGSINLGVTPANNVTLKKM